MIVNGEEWVQSEDGQRYVRKEKTMTKTKEEYIVERCRAIRPFTIARFEREYEEKYKPRNPPKSKRTYGKIDWTKPLVCDRLGVEKAEFVESLTSGYLFEHNIVRLTYKNGYTYYVLYDDYGRSAGSNAGTINVKNKVTSWGRSAWMVLDKQGGMLSSKWDSKHEARQWAHSVYGGVKMDEFQYIRYDYTESR